MADLTLGGSQTVSGRVDLLRRALLIDAIGSGAPIPVLLLAAAWLSPHLGLSETLLRWAGVVLIPFVALLIVTVARPVPPASLVRLIIGFNLVWATASVGLLVIGAVRPTTPGTLVVLVQAAMVLGLAIAQYLGLRQRG